MKAPCKSCPWRRTSLAGALAVQGQPGLAEGFTWTRMAAQALAPMWLPCHSLMDSEKPRLEQNPLAVKPCYGAGVFRTHVNFEPATKYLPTYPADRDTVFASPVEFLAHHMRLSIAEASAAWKVVPATIRIQIELNAAAVDLVPSSN